MTQGDIAPSPGVSEQGKEERTGKTITQGQTKGLGDALLQERKRQSEIKSEKQVLPCPVARGREWGQGGQGSHHREHIQQDRGDLLRAFQPHFYGLFWQGGGKHLPAQEEGGSLKSPRLHPRWRAAAPQPAPGWGAAQCLICGARGNYGGCSQGTKQAN